MKTNTTPPAPQLINEHNAASYLGMSVIWMRKQRGLQAGPAYIKVGSKSVRYDVDDLRDWKDSCRIQPQA